MYITDNSIISKVTPLYPDLMAEDTEEKIRKLFNDMKEKEQKLSKVRMVMLNLEQEVKRIKENWKKQSAMFNIEFAKKEIHEIKEQVYFGVVNPEDSRNCN